MLNCTITCTSVLLSGHTSSRISVVSCVLSTCYIEAKNKYSLIIM